MIGSNGPINKRCWGSNFGSGENDEEEETTNLKFLSCAEGGVESLSIGDFSEEGEERRD